MSYLLSYVLKWIFFFKLRKRERKKERERERATFSAFYPSEIDFPFICHQDVALLFTTSNTCFPSRNLHKPRLRYILFGNRWNHIKRKVSDNHAVTQLSHSQLSVIFLHLGSAAANDYVFLRKNGQIASLVVNWNMRLGTHKEVNHASFKAFFELLKATIRVAEYTLWNQRFFFRFLLYTGWSLPVMFHVPMLFFVSDDSSIVCDIAATA